MKIFNNRIHAFTKIAAGIVFMLALQLPALAADDAEPVFVNVDNFVRAETAAQFDRALEMVDGGLNTFLHFRRPLLPWINSLSSA